MGGNGWTIFDVFLMRVYPNSMMSSPDFPVRSSDWSGELLGLDAVACVHRIEPWLVEVYNSTRTLTTVRILKKSASVDEYESSGRRAQGLGGLQRSLYSFNKSAAIFAAFDASSKLWQSVRASHSTLTRS